MGKLNFIKVHLTINIFLTIKINSHKMKTKYQSSFQEQRQKYGLDKSRRT